MEKSLKFLIIVGSLISIGISLSFYSAQLNIQDIVIQEGIIPPEGSFEIKTELNPEINDQGVFVVHIDDFEEKSFSFRILDSFGTELTSKILERNPYQENFMITVDGLYTLEISNSGPSQAKGIGAIGYYPEETVQYIGYAGTAIIVVGLIGLIILGITTIKNKRKNRFN